MNAERRARQAESERLATLAKAEAATPPDPFLNRLLHLPEDEGDAVPPLCDFPLLPALPPGKAFGLDVDILSGDLHWTAASELLAAGVLVGPPDEILVPKSQVVETRSGGPARAAAEKAAPRLPERFVVTAAPAQPPATATAPSAAQDQLWEACSEALRQDPEFTQFAQFLGSMAALMPGKDTLMLALDPSQPELARLREPPYPELFKAHLKRLTGRDISLIITSARTGQQERQILNSSDEVRQRVATNPFVQALCQFFGGRVVDARGQ
ncbi:MAG: hypothetical protein RL095_2209 [Verrucomicrobiota bacterium]